MTAPFYRRTHCRMCDGTALVEAMRLTPTPPGNTLRHEAELALPETLYPLELHFCRDCHHVALGRFRHEGLAIFVASPGKDRAGNSGEATNG